MPEVGSARSLRRKPSSPDSRRQFGVSLLAARWRFRAGHRIADPILRSDWIEADRSCVVEGNSGGAPETPRDTSGTHRLGSRRMGWHRPTRLSWSAVRLDLGNDPGGRRGRGRSWGRTRRSPRDRVANRACGPAGLQNQRRSRARGIVGAVRRAGSLCPPGKPGTRLGFRHRREARPAEVRDSGMHPDVLTFTIPA
jgi:hypothetical protein